MGLFSFPKSERLYKKKSIQELFERGSSFYLYPFKVLFLENADSDQVNQVLISVSKRNFKKAVDRNKIKRRVREAYRLGKDTITPDKKFQMAYIYTAKEILDSSKIQVAMLESFKRLKA